MQVRALYCYVFQVLCGPDFAVIYTMTGVLGGGGGKPLSLVSFPTRSLHKACLSNNGISLIYNMYMYLKGALRGVYTAFNASDQVRNQEKITCIVPRMVSASHYSYPCIIHGQKLEMLLVFMLRDKGLNLLS